MVAIVGNATQVTSNVILTGFISISYSFQPEINRLWQLGSFNAYDIEKTTQISINVSNYGGASTAVPLAASNSCEDSSAQMVISIIPAACVADSVAYITNQLMFINSYSYSKDYKGWGQESWSLQSKPSLEGYTGEIYMLQGIATGDRLIGPDIVSNDGIVLTGSDGIALNDGQGYDISVSAGDLSIGEFGEKEFGVITQVGAAIGKEDGRRGSANASIPHQAIYL